MKLSFVIPAFNSVTWLPHAVSSALQQCVGDPAKKNPYKDIEVVIVNDASTDRTEEYLDFIEKDKRVKIVRNSVNLGRSRSRNIGNREATGDIICVLDADDIAQPNRAELTARKFKAKPVDYVYGAAVIIDALGRPMGEMRADAIHADFLDEKKNPMLHNGIVHSTVAYTKEFAERFQYPDGEMAKLGLDDWAQQVTAKTSGAVFDFIPQKLACYRELSSQITKTRDQESVMVAKRGFLTGLKVTA